MRAWIPTLLVAVALAFPVGPISGQTVEVGLRVTESTGGLFRERFDSALTALDEVQVVERAEPADYVLTVAVLCMPDPEACGEAGRYSVSVTLSEPLTPARLKGGLTRTGDRTLSSWKASPEAAAYLQRFQQIHAAWATEWDRDTYGAAVDRLVRGIDARCFQKRRIFETRRAALYARGDSAAARDLTPDAVPEQGWLC